MPRAPRSLILLLGLCASFAFPTRATALERLCDTAFEDCREPLLQLIANETVAIDVAFWFMEDSRYSAELARAVQRGVRVRVIFDSDELLDDPHGIRRFALDQLTEAGIPMREKVDNGINHWKLMLFVAQGTIQFSGANHSDEAFVPQQPYVNYVDEVIYFTDRLDIINSFKTKFDDVWTDTTGMMADYANVTVLERSHPTFPIAPEMNFAPFESFRQRSVDAYRAETSRVDAIIYRITDRAHTDALIEAVKDGVRIRLLTEPHQYRDESRLWHAWNVERLYVAGLEHPIDGAPAVEIRHRAHAGLMHEKLTLLESSGTTIFGSSNWTSASSDYQLEHNLFTTDPAFFAWSRTHFDRKWFNQGPSPETTPFVPLPPDVPVLREPADGAALQPVSPTLRWSPGPWAHRYDVYLGTSPSSLDKIVDDMELGPYDKAIVVPGLSAGTTYYWRVVSRTMAGLSHTSPTWSFTTQPAPPGNVAPAVSLTAPVNGASYGAPAHIVLTATATDSDGTIARVNFYAGTTLIGAAFAAPYTLAWADVPAGTYSLTAKATDSAGVAATSNAAVVAVGGVAPPLPAPWAAQDIGAVGPAGRSTLNSGTWTVSGSGADIWDSADAFHYAYQPLTGDGTIVARIVTLEDVDPWTKAGVMMREALTAGSRHAFMATTPTTANGLAFQRRQVTSGGSAHTAGGALAAPIWVKLTREGSTVSAYRSPDGAAWTLVGSDVIAMAPTIYVGLAVSSHSTTDLAIAAFDNVSVFQGGTPPPPQNAPPSVSLTAPAAGASFVAPASIVVDAAASDSDGTVARVEFFADGTLIGTDTTSPYSTTWSSVAAGSYQLTARAVDNADAATVSSAVAITVHTNSTALPAPWVAGDVGATGATGQAEVAGSVWMVSGAGADVWGTTDAFHYVYQPLVGDGSIVARVLSVEQVDVWTKAGVMIRETLTAGSRHAFMIATPSPVKGLAFQRRVSTDGPSSHTAGGAVSAPVWLRLTRTGSTITAASSPDGLTWTVVGSDTLVMPSAVYIGLAVTSHAGGTLATATFDNVTVTPGGGGPPQNVLPSVDLTAPADGASFTAPATIELTATASDSDGTVTGVEFYSGSTLIGTDTSAPYAMTWSNVPAGNYSLVARAIDNDGGAQVSSSVAVQVTSGPPAGPLPAGWSSADIGAVAVPGSAGFVSGAYVLSGSGADIWGASDAFHFAYRTMTGDGTIVARVDALSPTHPWSKTGVMIRASLSASSRHAMMIVSSANGLAFQRRTVDGGSTSHTGGGGGTAPIWVRLQRSGSQITASVSSDGATWQTVGSDTMDLPATVYVGLPLTSHSAGIAADATVSNVAVTP